ncbi:NfeD family protein [Leptolyngbya sp. 'hensonii']|uniref:NfeD family protein n=1 Tax=Leptolyngbya sp. 'hensonii' TaxID=1922337 RepID=UPI0015C57F7A|nr:NfeD family protein [Leptolyngbya sp. 'hensonii']
MTGFKHALLVTDNLSPLLSPGNQGDFFEQRAIVDETIQPGIPGRIRFQSSLWPALCRQNTVLTPGTTVRVVDRRNLTLVVEFVSEEDGYLFPQALQVELRNNRNIYDFADILLFALNMLAKSFLLL